MDRIILEPGALESVPIRDLAVFLQGHGLELVHKPDGLQIRKQARMGGYFESAPIPEESGHEQG